MNDGTSEEAFISVRNESDWWVSVGLTKFVSITGAGPFEEGQALWIAPGRTAVDIKVSIPDDARPVPLLVGTRAGLFTIHHRPSGAGSLVEVLAEQAGEAAVVISNDPSSLGLWHLIIGVDGHPLAEHEVV